MIVRVLYKPDKTVAIIHPAPKSKRPDESEAKWLKRVFNKVMQGELKGLPYDDIDSSELPQSRENRDAWEGEKGKSIYINVKKAKAQREKREKERLIQEKVEQIAIRELKEEGKL